MINMARASKQLLLACDMRNLMNIAHCTHQNFDCWAYDNMLGIFKHYNQLSLAARSLQCRTLSILQFYTFVNCFGARDAGRKSASVWQHEICGNTSPVTCFASRFRRFADFYIPQCRAKGAFGERLWKDQRCAVQRRWVHRVWIKIGSPQSSRFSMV